MRAPRVRLGQVEAEEPDELLRLTQGDPEQRLRLVRDRLDEQIDLGVRGDVVDDEGPACAKARETAGQGCQICLERVALIGARGADDP